MKSDNFATQNETIMKRQKAILFIICHLVYGTAGAQDWTARQCMQYAVEHNHVVKRAELELDNYKASERELSADSCQTWMQASAPSTTTAVP